MKTIMPSTFGPSDTLTVADRAVPEPTPASVVIRTVASALNPIDLSTRSGRLTDAGLIEPSATTATLGWDIAGHVSAVGSEVRRFSVGDAVIGLRDLLDQPGTHAEYVGLWQGAVALAPRTIPLEWAAALPLCGLTADGALRAASLRPGDTVLVTGAGGGVGSIAVDLAHLHGIEVIAVARSHQLQTLGEKGVLAAITDDDLTSRVRSIRPAGVDAVIDTAILGIQAHPSLRAEGTFVTLVRPFAPPPLRGTTVIVHEVHADGGHLAELAALVDSGALHLAVAATYPFERSAEAHRHAEAGHLDGRIVLTWQ